MKINRWIILGLAATVFLSTCGQPNPTPDANSGPQEEYPEFTLEAQQAAMQSVEEMRQQARVEGLRDKIPPADWIEVAYHGLVVDANLDVIEMDFDTVSKMQESLFSILYEPVREKAMQQYGEDLEKLFYDQDFNTEQQLIVRTGILHGLLNISDPKLQELYGWRHDLIRKGGNNLFNWIDVVFPDYILELFQKMQFKYFILFEVSTTYVNSCRAQSVPIPPDWPDSRWQNQGQLAFPFISANLTANVYAYKDPAVAGVCYALPRRDSSGSIQLLGIICMSDVTGKACFWDNKTVNNVLLTGANLTLDIDTIGSGLTLSENCTMCHRGKNPFIIHPGSALDLSRAAAVGGPYDTDPVVRYTPMGQANWINPPPLVLTAPPLGQSSCTACHEIPQTRFNAGTPYCSQILASAAQFTMPPTGPTRAGWPGSTIPVSPDYADHINNQLSKCP